MKLPRGSLKKRRCNKTQNCREIPEAIRRVCLYAGVTLSPPRPPLNRLDTSAHCTRKSPSRCPRLYEAAFHRREASARPGIKLGYKHPPYAICLSCPYCSWKAQGVRSIYPPQTFVDGTVTLSCKNKHALPALAAQAAGIAITRPQGTRSSTKARLAGKLHEGRKTTQT